MACQRRQRHKSYCAPTGKVPNALWNGLGGPVLKFRKWLDEVAAKDNWMLPDHALAPSVFDWPRANPEPIYTKDLLDESGLLVRKDFNAAMVENMLRRREGIVANYFTPEGTRGAQVLNSMLCYERDMQGHRLDGQVDGHHLPRWQQEVGWNSDDFGLKSMNDPNYPIEPATAQNPFGAPQGNWRTKMTYLNEHNDVLRFYDDKLAVNEEFYKFVSPASEAEQQASMSWAWFEESPINGPPTLFGARKPSDFEAKGPEYMELLQNIWKTVEKIMELNQKFAEHKTGFVIKATHMTGGQGIIMFDAEGFEKGAVTGEMARLTGDDGALVGFKTALGLLLGRDTKKSSNAKGDKISFDRTQQIVDLLLNKSQDASALGDDVTRQGIVIEYIRSRTELNIFIGLGHFMGSKWTLDPSLGISGPNGKTMLGQENMQAFERSWAKDHVAEWHNQRAANPLPEDSFTVDEYAEAHRYAMHFVSKVIEHDVVRVDICRYGHSIRHLLKYGWQMKVERNVFVSEVSASTGCNYSTVFRPLSTSQQYAYFNVLKEHYRLKMQPTAEK